VTLQLPADRVQVVLLKAPVLLVVNVTVPVGVTAPTPDESETVAVHDAAVPTLTELGLQLTVVVVVRNVDVTTNVPKLPV
jgi:hypothetical protein